MQVPAFLGLISFLLLLSFKYIQGFSFFNSIVSFPGVFTWGMTLLID